MIYSPEVKKGDILVVFGDDESRAADAAAGYFLDASFGKVTSIDVAGLKAHVTWLFAESYSSKFRPWYLASGELHSSSLEESELFTGDTNSAAPLKAKLGKNKKLCEATKAAIRDVIGDEFDKFV